MLFTYDHNQGRGDPQRGPFIIKIDGEYYRIRYRDSGFVHKEDLGLWRADKVTWDGDHWGYHDDDDWLIDDDGRVVAREIGWGLRRVIVWYEKKNCLSCSGITCTRD